MKKPSIPLLFGTASGLLIGGLTRHGISEHETSHIPSTDSSEQDIAEVPAVSMPTAKRPTLEQIVGLQGSNDAGLLARYLEDATIDEIISLLDLVRQDEVRIHDLRWMIETRGIELDPEAMIAWGKAQKPRDNVLNGLFTRWAKIDPHAALEASLSESPWIKSNVIQAMEGADLDRAMEQVAAVGSHASELQELEKLKWVELANTNIHAALKGVMALEHRHDRRSTLDAVLESWMERDAMAAILWIEDQGDLEGRIEMMAKGIEKLAETHPDLAQDKLASLPQGLRRSELEGVVVRQWAEQDLDEALSWVKELPKGTRRDLLFDSMTELIEKRDPESLFALVKELEIDPQNNRSTAFDVKLDLYSRDRQTGSRSLHRSLNHAALELAMTSPREALLALHDVGIKPSLEVAEIWIKSDPEGAANWAIGLSEKSSFTSYAQRVIFTAWAAKSPQDSASFLLENNLVRRNSLTRLLMSEWAQRDAEGAISWIKSLEKPIMKEPLLSMALADLARQNPQEALQHVNGISSRHSQKNIIETAAESWRKNDPASAMEWLANQSHSAAVDQVMAKTSKEWVLIDPHAASEWINTMEAGSLRDRAVAGMVHALISTSNPNPDFDAAEVWVKQIADASLREQWSTQIDSRR